MNSRILFFYSFLIASLWSCEKENQERKVTCFQGDVYGYLDRYKIDSICTSEICTRYLSIWEELFKEKNNLSDTFFNEHIILCKSHLNTWKEGISIHICYKVIMDWAIAWNCESFMIEINSDSYYYPELPRDEYLSKDEIRSAIEQDHYVSRMDTVSNSNIIFHSKNEAILKLVEDANVDTLCMSEIYLDKKTGNLMLKAWAEYENEENSCIQGKLDLINGDTEITDTPCVIFNN